MTKWIDQICPAADLEAGLRMVLEDGDHLITDVFYADNGTEGGGTDVVVRFADRRAFTFRPEGLIYVRFPKARCSL